MTVQYFFYTYGTDDTQPFRGGWTLIIAPDRTAADTIFKLYHPNKYKGLLNCADVYSAEDFFETAMPTEGNFGIFCHEIISVSRKVIDVEQ